MITKMFDACANGMSWLAELLDPWFPGGMNYEKINVIICCGLIPAVLLASLGLNAAFLLGLL